MTDTAISVGDGVSLTPTATRNGFAAGPKSESIVKSVLRPAGSAASALKKHDDGELSSGAPPARSTGMMLAARSAATSDDDKPGQGDVSELERDELTATHEKLGSTGRQKSLEPCERSSAAT